MNTLISYQYIIKLKVLHLTLEILWVHKAHPEMIQLFQTSIEKETEFLLRGYPICIIQQI